MFHSSELLFKGFMTDLKRTNHLIKLLSKAIAAVVFPDDSPVEADEWNITPIASIQVCGSLRGTGESSLVGQVLTEGGFATAHQLLLIEFDGAISDRPDLQNARVLRIERFNLSGHAGIGQHNATDILRLYG